MNWTSEDFRNGLCTVADVGTPRPPLVVVPTPPAVSEIDLAKSFSEIMTDAAKQAILEIGPVEFLKANQDVLSKIAVKVVAPQPLPERKYQPFEWPAWLTARRLAYQEGLEVKADILNDGPEKEAALARERERGASSALPSPADPK